MSPRLIVLAVFIAGLAVTGCGKRGTLERPPPMWGHPKDTQKEEQSGRDSGDQRSGPERGALAKDPYAHASTIAQDPMDGLPPDPRAGSGQPSNLNPH
jgi:predicted small lipoprotein YifL